MRRAHVTRQVDYMGLNERTKTVTLHLAAPIWRAQSWEHDPTSVFNKLFERWENSQKTLLTISIGQRRTMTTQTRPMDTIPHW